MATRTLDSRRDRLATMLAIPFMSCSARLPVYTLFIGAFVPRGWQSGAMFALYLLGVVVAMATARFARKVLYRGEQSHLVMELPPYRVPTFVGWCTRCG
jgi:ferrous iron transport protein B